METLGTATHSFAVQRTAGTPFSGQLRLLRSLPAVSGCLKYQKCGTLVICPRASPRALRSCLRAGLVEHNRTLSALSSTRSALQRGQARSISLVHMCWRALFAFASPHKVWQAIFGADNAWQTDCMLHQLR